MEKKGISGSTLKLIAIVTMVIDHIAAAILGRFLLLEGVGGLNMENTAAAAEWFSAHALLYGSYTVMRAVGRIAFPIFCFLLVEGFTHTNNIKKYALRLGLFALISEIPFDLAFQGTALEFGYQNVFFTLTVGFVAMMLFRAVELNEELYAPVRYLLFLLIAVLCMVWAHVLHTDYAARGVFSIIVLYLFRGKGRLQLLIGALSFCWEPTALFGFIPLAFYNGKRGLKLKYLFYAVYPAHLFLIYIVCAAMGIAGTAVV